mmetsp:Transcript_1510/g.2261  ORF Transcript_1510/g.2261 Transcript_1510/m.2261 type:complete len:258 (+) Transcript_1510:409-1182(+)
MPEAAMTFARVVAMSGTSKLNLARDVSAESPRDVQTRSNCSTAAGTMKVMGLTVMGSRSHSSFSPSANSSTVPSSGSTSFSTKCKHASKVDGSETTISALRASAVYETARFPNAAAGALMWIGSSSNCHCSSPLVTSQSTQTSSRSWSSTVFRMSNWNTTWLAKTCVVHCTTYSASASPSGCGLVDLMSAPNDANSAMLYSAWASCAAVAPASDRALLASSSATSSSSSSLFLRGDTTSSTTGRLSMVNGPSVGASL